MAMKPLQKNMKPARGEPPKNTRMLTNKMRLAPRTAPKALIQRLKFWNFAWRCTDRILARAPRESEGTLSSCQPERQTNQRAKIKSPTDPMADARPRVDPKSSARVPNDKPMMTPIPTVAVRSALNANQEYERKTAVAFGKTRFLPSDYTLILMHVKNMTDLRGVCICPKPDIRFVMGRQRSLKPIRFIWQKVGLSLTRSERQTDLICTARTEDGTHA